MRYKSNDFRSWQTIKSIEFQEVEGDYEDIHLRFAAFLHCDRCGEVSIVAGTGGVDRSYNRILEQEEITEYFHPKTFVPGPQVFDFPEGLPVEISSPLLKAFGIFLGDPNSAANKVRVAAERFLDHQRIRKTRPNTNRKPMMLNERLSLFKKKSPALADNLMAIKWIGNHGSHTETLKIADVLDAFEIFSHVLDEVFTKRAARVGRLSKNINQRKGSRHR